MHCFSKSLIVIRRYHHFTHRAANHCCQSLSLVPTENSILSTRVRPWRAEEKLSKTVKVGTHCATNTFHRFRWEMC